MIYITGDLHGSHDIRKLNTKNFPEQREMTKADYLIVAGDFGLVWSNDKEDNFWLDWLEKKSFTVLFIDGNHENFNLLNEYPVEEWNGGKVHFIRPSVIHLMRGQVFELQGKKIFTFGGAASRDRQYRKPNVSWWPQEIPTEAEFQEGIKNLQKHDMTVDYIVTHTAPVEVVSQINVLLGEKTYDTTSQMLDFFMKKVYYKHWYFGHFHTNKKTGKFTALYDNIELLGVSKYSETTIKNIVKKAKEHFDTNDFIDVTICASEDCPKKYDCYRYAITYHLLKNGNYGHTATLFYQAGEECKCFIKLE